jgi:hypothetical protein
MKVPYSLRRLIHIRIFRGDDQDALRTKNDPGEQIETGKEHADGQPGQEKRDEGTV